jgi:hypothetical protein
VCLTLLLQEVFLMLCPSCVHIDAVDAMEECNFCEQQRYTKLRSLGFTQVSHLTSWERIQETKSAKVEPMDRSHHDFGKPFKHRRAELPAQSLAIRHSRRRGLSTLSSRESVRDLVTEKLVHRLRWWRIRLLRGSGNHLGSGRGGTPPVLLSWPLGAPRASQEELGSGDGLVWSRVSVVKR